MLLFLFSQDELSQLFDRLGYQFTPAMARKNIDYYISAISRAARPARAFIWA
jgi:alpha,alpha-trehalase